MTSEDHLELLSIDRELWHAIPRQPDVPEVQVVAHVITILFGPGPDPAAILDSSTRHVQAQADEFWHAHRSEVLFDLDFTEDVRQPL